MNNKLQTKNSRPLTCLRHAFYSIRHSPNAIVFWVLIISLILNLSFDFAQDGTSNEPQSNPELTEPFSISPARRLVRQSFSVGGSLGAGGDFGFRISPRYIDLAATPDQLR